jgi:phosphoribosylglycinamide formyltransferase-1
LSERILKEEHRIYPMAIRLIIEDRLVMRGRRVLIKGGDAKISSLINPDIGP